MPSGLHTWSTTAANNATADSNINWAEGQAPASVNDSARSEMAVHAKHRDDNNGSLTTGGTSTSYTLTTNTVFTSLALMDNQTLAFTMSVTSGAAPTLNVDGLGAKFIRNATGVTLPTGALLSGSVYRATYDNGAGEWLIHNQPGVLPTNSVATASIADDAVTYAKMQNVSATSRLLGRASSGAGDTEEITLGSGLALAGTTLNSSSNGNELNGFLSGLALSTAGSSSTFSVAVGAASDASAGGLMYLSSAMSKTTASWAVGSGNGALDTGSIAVSTWYHVYLIKRTDTGVVDVLISTSQSPTMPSSYTLKRRIGSMKTDGSAQWIAFTQVADTFIWSAAVVDVNAIATTTSRVATTLTVAPGPSVTALMHVMLTASAGASTASLVISALEADSTPSSTNANAFANTNQTNAGDIAAVTNGSAQIAVRSSNTTGTLTIRTYGWIDPRGK